MRSLQRIRYIIGNAYFLRRNETSVEGFCVKKSSSVEEAYDRQKKIKKTVQVSQDN